MFLSDIFSYRQICSFDLRLWEEKIRSQMIGGLICLIVERVICVAWVSLSCIDHVVVIWSNSFMSPWYKLSENFNKQKIVCQIYSVREAPRNCLQVQMGIAKMGRGVSSLARMVWGTDLEKFKWAICLIVGGQIGCRDGLGHLFS